MKVKFILMFLILVGGIVFVQSASYPAPFVSGETDAGTISSESKSLVSGSSLVVVERSNPRFENYSSDIQNVLKKDPIDWTIKENCIFIKGCWNFKEKICYPFGYVKEKQYCSDNLLDKQEKRTYGFVNQRGWGNLCEQNLNVKVIYVIKEMYSYY